MAKKYKITLEITNVGGICMSGCKVGQKFDLSDNRTDNLCGTFYHSLFPTISVFDYDGVLWFLSDKNKLEVRCPDYVNDVRGILKREYVGELKLPPEDCLWYMISTEPLLCCKTKTFCPAIDAHLRDGGICSKSPRNFMV